MAKKFTQPQIPQVLVEGEITDLSPDSVFFEQSICRCGDYLNCQCPAFGCWIAKSQITRSRLYDPSLGDEIWLWKRGKARFHIPSWLFQKMEGSETAAHRRRATAIAA